MKIWKLIILCFVFLNFMMTFSGLAAELESTENQESNICVNPKLGIQFYCEDKWKVRMLDDAVLVVISSEPMATVTVARIDTDIKYLSQLTHKVLKDKELYKEGFRAERSKLGGKDTLQIKAFSKQYADRRVLDFFFIHEEALYGVLFAVYPKDSWDQYKFLIKNIVDSFEFLK